MKKAFTMVELIVVIVLIGVLAFFLMPNKADTKTLEAARQIISHIRYAQHLALNNDKFDSNDATWYKKFWRVSFSEAAGKLDDCKNPIKANDKDTKKCIRYSVWQDSAGDKTGNANSLDELALDPAEPGKYLAADYDGNKGGAQNKFSKKMNLTDTYEIKGIDIKFPGTTGANNNSKSFIFDDLGRVFAPYGTGGAIAYQSDKLVKDFIRITLTGKGGDEVKILVFAQTGYACVENIDSNCKATTESKK